MENRGRVVVSKTIFVLYCHISQGKFMVYTTTILENRYTNEQDLTSNINTKDQEQCEKKLRKVCRYIP